MECVRLVSSAGVEPDDEDQADVLSTGPTTIVIDRERLEAPFLQACGAAHFEDLVAVEALHLRHVLRNALHVAPGYVAFADSRRALLRH